MGKLTIEITGPYAELKVIRDMFALHESAEVRIISDTAESSSALGGDPVAITHAEEHARHYMRTWTKREGRFRMRALRAYVRKHIKKRGYVPDHACVDHALTVFADHYQLHRSGRGYIWSDTPFTNQAPRNMDELDRTSEG